MANKLPATQNKTRKNTPQKENVRAEQIRMPERSSYDISRPIHQIIPVVLCAVAVFFMICFFIEDAGGLVGEGVRAFFFGLLGRLTTVFVPFAMIAFAFSWRQSIRNRCIVMRLVSTLLMLCLISCLVYTIAEDADIIRIFDLENAFLDSDVWTNGGVIGNTLAFLFVNLFDKVGTYILCVVIFIIFAIVCFGFTPSVLAAKIRDRAKGTVQRKVEERRVLRDDKEAQLEEFRQMKQEMRRDEQRAKVAAFNEERRARYEEKIEQRKVRNEQKNEDRRLRNEFAAQNKANNRASRAHFKDEYDISLDDDDAHPAYSEDIEELNESVTPFDDGEVATLEELNAVTESVPKFDIHMPPSMRKAEVEADTAKQAQTKRQSAEPLVTEDMISTKTHIDTGDKPASSALTPEEEERAREKEALEAMYASYEFPPFSLLTPSEETQAVNITEEINANAAKLVETLTSFNVRTHITSVSRGPRITRYELVPDAGVRIRSIANLIDDISMNLASAGIRIEAPIPGKSAVGIEVPNKISSTVRLRELLETDAFRNAGPRTTVCVGADVTGDPVFCDLAKMPHTLIAGATGMGKSVCINTIIASILYKARPDEVKLILVDPKKVELGVYNGIPHLLVPVVIDPKKAAGALSWAVCEMERRFDLIEEIGVRDIKGYNKERENHPEYEKLPHIIIIIDELNDLMMVASDSVEASICRIAQKARAAGIHLIIGTQRPSVDVITGTIKANIPSRMAFHVASQIDSRTILDTTGAEKLLNNGDMLFYPVGVPKPLRVQGAFISDDEVEKITGFLKQNVPTDAYNRDIMEDIERESEKCAQNGRRSEASSTSTDDDREETLANPKFREAVEVAIDEGKISTSLIQRRLKLGFGKAARFIDIMQKMGIVSEPDGQKPRTTLITRDQYYEMLSRMDDDRTTE